MRITLGLSLLALAAAPALAQYAPPPGPYQRQCSNITMNGQMMSATCRGDRTVGNSSINILSCSTAISVDADGGLTCVGPGGGAPPSVRPAPPGYATAPGQAPDYAPNSPGYGRPGYDPNRPGYGRDAITLFGARDWRGPPLRLEGPAPNLRGMNLDAEVRSIQLDRRARPWLVCTEPRYRGRCVTVSRSVSDVRQLGLRGEVSSVRPAR